jgi:hypothetical protein
MPLKIFVPDSLTGQENQRVKTKRGSRIPFAGLLKKGSRNLAE